MTTFTWIGGGNNDASNPNDWSPTGVPQPDAGALQVSSRATTININGNVLPGDGLGAVGVSNFTANLTNKATLSSAGFMFGNSVTFNLSGHSTLLDFGDSRDTPTINMSGNSVLTTTFLDRTTATVNISGNDTAELGLSTIEGAGYIVNLSHLAIWTGTLDYNATSGMEGPAAGVTVNGGATTFFNNDGASTVGQATINADVIGAGSIDVVSVDRGSGITLAGKLEFMQFVGPYQSVQDNATVQIDQPSEFFGNTSLAAPTAGVAAPEIDLESLANADSYSFKHDILLIFTGNKVIDTLRLSTASAFAVVQTPGSVNIVAIDSTHPTAGTILPIHS